MPVICERLVKKPRVQRRCARCNRSIKGPALRLYGYAHEGDKPYAMFVHPDSCSPGLGDSAETINPADAPEKE